MDAQANLSLHWAHRSFCYPLNLLSGRVCVCPFITLFDACHILWTAHARVLKFHLWIPCGKIPDPYFFSCPSCLPFWSLPLWKNQNEILSARYLYKYLSYELETWSADRAQCANHLYTNRNLRYSKWWPSFLLCCFWRVFSVYEELILLWFCLLDSIFKQHYYLRWFVWSEVLYFSISFLNHQTWRKFRRITCLLVTWH